MVPPAQQVLDTGFAWACLNHRFEIAAFLLEHGANINTTWNTHEPVSVLHPAAMSGDYELAKFLIDRGIDMTICDYRWGGTAEGWAYHVGKDRGMHEFLATTEQARALQRQPCGGTTSRVRLTGPRLRTRRRTWCRA